MLKDEISLISIHKILSTMSFQAFSGSFLRRGTEILKDLYTI